MNETNEGPRVESRGWQPIDTAPKDGTECVCLAPEYRGPVMLRFGGDKWIDWDFDTYAPTHWMPLPEPPQ